MKARDLTNMLGLTDLKNPVTPRSSSAYDSQGNDILEERRILHKWHVRSREDFSLSSSKVTRSLIIIGGILLTFLLMVGEFMLILLALALLFVGYALRNSQPPIVYIEVSNHGVYYDNTFYPWNGMRHYFKRINKNELCIDLLDSLPGRIYLRFNSEKDFLLVKDILNKYLPYLEEEPRTVFDNMYDNFLSKFKLSDNEESSTKKETQA
jgi:hypothetical protein